jgi:hypothetical protein
MEEDPKKFLRGDFEYCRIETTSKVSYKKNSMKEVITVEDGEITIESRIKWVDETNYILIAEKVDGSNMPEGIELYVSVESIKDNKMIYSYHLEGEEPKRNCLLRID